MIEPFLLDPPVIFFLANISMGVAFRNNFRYLQNNLKFSLGIILTEIVFQKGLKEKCVF